MSKQRYLDTKFWDDSYIVSLDPVEKLLFIYFLTNPLTNIIGIYEITIRRIAFDTGIDKDMVLKILDRFELDKKIRYKNGWIVVKNFIKHQKDSPSINKGIELLLKQIPPNLQWSDTLPIGSVGECGGSVTYLNPNLNINPNPNPNSNTNLNKDIKERQASVLEKSKEEEKPEVVKEDEPLIFNFEEKCWEGLTDWRIKKFSGKYPMLTINYILEDEMKMKFLSDPKGYKEIIRNVYKGKVEDLVWAWLGQAKKFYLKDHPEYRGETANRSSPGVIDKSIGSAGSLLKDLKIINYKEGKE